MRKPINEVPMNPGEFKKAIAQPSGVKIGFEFEVCIAGERLKDFRPRPNITLEELCHDLVDNDPDWGDDIVIREFDDYGITELRKPAKDEGEVFNTLKELRNFDSSIDLYYLAHYVYKVSLHTLLTKCLVVDENKFKDTVYRLMYRANHPNIRDKSIMYAGEITRNTFGRTTEFNDYHEKKKVWDRWYVEPDGSLRPNKGEDGCAEIVSPPLPATEAIETLKRFYALAKESGFYTNTSTGLHINVSIPEQIDVLKLAIFLGDRHVLKEFDREHNNHVRSTFYMLQHRTADKDQFKVAKKPDLKATMNTIGTLAKSISRDHVSSINFNGKYVSFRHAGGDYLNKPDAILTLIGRFIRAMVIASNPNLYRREYLTKLAILLDQAKTNQKADITKHDKFDKKLSELRTTPVNVKVICVYGNVDINYICRQLGIIPQEFGRNAIRLHDPAVEEKLRAEFLKMNKGHWTFNLKKGPVRMFCIPTGSNVVGKVDYIMNYGDRSIMALHKPMQVPPGSPLHQALIKNLLTINAQMKPYKK